MSKISLEKLPIVEVFTSIQGEGKYVGCPSTFIRVSGCNLRCCFKDTICDTPYTSFRPEDKKLGPDDVVNELHRHPNVTDIVITGGEPMLYADAIEELIEYVSQKMGYSYFVTVETNGTLPCSQDTLVDLFSISPKLKTSLPIPGHEYQWPDGSSELFTEQQVEVLDRTRFNPDAIVQLLSSNASVQLKFVYSGKESVQDIDNFLQAIHDRRGYPVNESCVMLMPEGVTNELLTKNAQEAVEVCVERGWTLCDRLHIRIWGNKRGV